MTRRSQEHATISDVHPPISKEQLYRELSKIAHKNQDFRDGIIDTAHFTTVQTDRVRPSDLLSLDDDDEWPTPFTSEEYTFTAQRHPQPDGTRTTQFTYSYSAALINVPLPLQIAESAFGLEGPEAIDNGGPSTLEHTVEFTVSPENFTACEAFTYLDENDDIIMRTCTCPPEPNEESGEDDMDLPRQQVQYDSDAARQLEVIAHLGTAEKDYTHELFSRTVEVDKAANDLAMAFAVLHSMKRTLRRQLGVRL